MKGSIRFNNDIIAEVDVDPSAASGSRLTSCKNLIDGQELGGGGGSSDFSTAEALFNVVAGNEAKSPNGVIIQNDRLDYSEGSGVSLNESANYVLYKGEQIIYGSDTAEISVSGNAEILEQEEFGGEWEYQIKITGDCTINLTGETLG